jgi:hypothetical protein
VGFRRAYHDACGEGWTVNHKKIQRLWREEDLRVPQRRHRKCLGVFTAEPQVTADAPNRVRAVDFQFDATTDGRPVKIVSIVDEHSRECLGGLVARSATADRVIESIDASRQVGLRRALIGLAIPRASEGRAARLCKAGFGSLEDVLDDGVDGLVAVEDIRPKVAASLVEYLTRLRPELGRLRGGSGGRAAGGQGGGDHRRDQLPRSGEKVARHTFQKLCEKAGAGVASVSVSTDMLITGAGVGAAELTWAEKFEVQVVDQTVIWQQLIAADIV